MNWYQSMEFCNNHGWRLATFQTKANEDLAIAAIKKKGIE